MTGGWDCKSRGAQEQHLIWRHTHTFDLTGWWAGQIGRDVERGAVGVVRSMRTLLARTGRLRSIGPLALRQPLSMLHANNMRVTVSV